MAARRLTTKTLLARHRPLWRIIARNPFLVGVRDGSLPVETFNRWLVQDRYFVDGLFSAVSRLLAAAPVEDRHLLVQGLRNLEGYLEWFDRILASRDLDPRTPIHPVNRAYLDYLASLGYECYPVFLVATWAQYRAYGDAWSWANPAAAKFRAVVRNWQSPAYDEYLRGLTRATDNALARSSPCERARAEEAFVQVAKYELAFWVMTMEETPGPA